MKKSKYIYFDKLNIKAKNNISKENDIINEGFVCYDKSECISDMLSHVNFIIEEDPECTHDNFLDRYDFEYEIFIISRDHIAFESSDERKKYINENLYKITKNNIYEFLVSVAEFAIEKYDYNGNLKYGFIDLWFDEIYMSEKDEGLKIPIFKEGDIVELINYPGKRYRIIHSHESNFTETEFPLHYNGLVFVVEDDKFYNDEDEELENSISLARSEIVRVED